MITPEIITVHEYSDKIAAGIGRLLPDLNSRLDGDPVGRERLERRIASDSHDQLIAVWNGNVVGAAAMSLVMGTIEGNDKAWLEDFVVPDHPDIRGQGVGFALFWTGVVSWSREHGAKQLLFTSRRSREAAYRFYYRQGCTNPDTTLFAHDLGHIDL